MEEIEIYSWATLDAIKKAAEIVEIVGDLHSTQEMSVFCIIEDDYLELCYSDTSNNYLRRYDDEEEFEEAIEERKEELGEGDYSDDDYDKDYEEEEEDVDFEEEEDY